MSASKFTKTAGVSLAMISGLTLAACGGSSSESADSSTSSNSGGSVEVFAAASLNAAGADLEKAYEEANPGVDITFNYAGSSKLVQQMEQGASPDLLITADTKTMDTAVESVADLSDVNPTVIATNALVLATAADNPANVRSVEDLSSADVTTAICAVEVPCGNLAHRELDNKGVTLGNATEEQNVSEVSTKVATGAVDAGFIYTTDAATIKKEQNITEIPLDDLEKNRYPMALTKTGAENSAASSFAEWLNGEQAQKILADYGFGSAE